jgi:hypothetical protein
MACSSITQSDYNRTFSKWIKPSEVCRPCKQMLSTHAHVINPDEIGVYGQFIVEN